MTLIDDNLQKFGIEITTATPPLANYLPFQHSGNFLFISGQLPMKDGKVQYTGQLGQNITVETAQAAAKLCTINILAQVKSALNGFDQVGRCIKLGGFVNATADFTDHASVINGASDFMVQIMGENGRHARAAVGVSSLPLNASVEIEAIFELKG